MRMHALDPRTRANFHPIVGNHSYTMSERDAQESRCYGYFNDEKKFTFPLGFSTWKSDFNFRLERDPLRKGLFFRIENREYGRK